MNDNKVTKAVDVTLEYASLFAFISDIKNIIVLQFVIRLIELTD